jgi:hypothetical protein
MIVTSKPGFVASTGFQIGTAGRAHLRRRHWLRGAGFGSGKQSARILDVEQISIPGRLQATKPKSDVNSTHTTVDSWGEDGQEVAASAGRSTEENEDTVVDLVKLFNKADTNGWEPYTSKSGHVARVYFYNS